MKGRVVDCLDDFSGGLVAESEEMSEIILTEFIVVGEQPFDSSVSLHRGLACHGYGHLGHRLDLAAVFLPFFQSLLLIG